MIFYKRIFFLFISICFAVNFFAQKIDIKTNSVTGAIDGIFISGDSVNMNWNMKTDGSQYSWITEEYGWGLGYFTESIGQKSVKRQWKTPVEIKNNGMDVSYHQGNIFINVKRYFEKNDLIENYTFTNTGDQTVGLYDIGIYTPFNDNYPDAQQCIHSRTNAHIWEGESAAYVNALRMGAYPPHLGLAVTQGEVKSYEIWERGLKKENSQTRGIIMLNLPDLALKPNESYTISWNLFSHSGNDDFYSKLLERGSVVASSNKYVFEKGETARVELQSLFPVEKCTIFKNGVPVSAIQKGNSWMLDTSMDEAGEVRFDFHYGTGKKTHVNCLVLNNIESLIQKRINFIRTHQQMNNLNDLRYGAYMVYDNDADSIYLNNTPNANPVDRDEGAERLGMGVLMATQYQLVKDPLLKESLLRYVKFVRKKLQTKDYVTYSSVGQQGRNRGYNYMWTASLYFQTYGITNDKQYAIDGFQTLQAMYRQFGHGFYAINIPVQLGLQTLKEAGLTKEYKILKNDFIKTGDIFINNGLNYPKHEVNYEQSIVAPAITFLAQLYLETNEQKYLDEVKRQLPVLEAFCGLQPSFHLNEIAIRHWDGYWFGKREMFGDTFPHYWSTLTGMAYYYYAKCTGDESYQKRAENITRNNLCLFFENGKASCAYLYPYKVNGIKTGFYDPYANDQDWALVYYLMINK